MTPQCLASVGGVPKNSSYINSGASIHNISNTEVLVGLVKLNRTLKIQTGGEPIRLLQIRPQQLLMLPMSTYNYSKNAISNMLPVTRLVNNYYTIYNIRYDNVICVLNKE